MRKLKMTYPLKDDVHVAPSKWAARSMQQMVGLGLIAPALVMVAIFFILPLTTSIHGAFITEAGLGLDNFRKSFDLYGPDMIFTMLVITASTICIGVLSVAIGGYLTLGENPRAQNILRWLYRWPLFIPFIVAGQVLRTFLAKNGMMNGALSHVGLIDSAVMTSWLDWRGMIFVFVWKQTPFVALLVAGAMAAQDRSTLEAARNLGAGRLRILWLILLPSVSRSLGTGLILSFVTMMSVLSVPLMINAQSPTMMTANIAFRVNAYGDYGVANALGAVTLLMTACFAAIYLKISMKDKA